MNSPFGINNYLPTSKQNDIYKLKTNTLNNLNDIQIRVSSLTSKLEDEIEKNLENTVGRCMICSNDITNERDACQALGNIYHARCFNCHSCGRLLKNKMFYMVKEKIYCEEDYLYSGFQQAAEKCALCNHLIMDTILQALGKSYHPGCFRCIICNKSLDGVPFTIDSDEKIYCIKDYHMMFSIVCEKCKTEISPNKDNGEIIRIIAQKKNYHIDCYICDDCGHQLTNEPPYQCIPIDNKLLCGICHEKYLK